MWRRVISIGFVCLFLFPGREPDQHAIFYSAGEVIFLPARSLEVVNVAQST